MSTEVHNGADQSHEVHTPVKEYVRIFLVLLALTGIEVGIYYANMGKLFLPTLFVLMVAKFMLVVLWFMHLKFDDKRFSRFFLMGLAGTVTLYSIVILASKVFLES